MDGQRRAVQAMDWSPEGKRTRSRPRKNWQETIREDIRCMDMAWSEAIDLAGDREGWKDCVARCAAMHWMVLSTKYYPECNQFLTTLCNTTSSEYLLLFLTVLFLKSRLWTIVVPQTSVLR